MYCEQRSGRRLQTVEKKKLRLLSIFTCLMACFYTMCIIKHTSCAYPLHYHTDNEERTTEMFTTITGLTELVHESNQAPGPPKNAGNTLGLILTTQPSLYTITITQSLGSSNHCLISVLCQVTSNTVQTTVGLFGIIVILIGMNTVKSAYRYPGISSVKPVRKKKRKWRHCSRNGIIHFLFSSCQETYLV